ncbi:transposon-encoded TnpW family protein [Ruminococcaceae bacterium OttesenSCG-928-A11]|nr:transposon-encoded TnpW family protein [Ruminococcaceae bacterium OttesenSCG-928-A11]
MKQTAKPIGVLTPEPIVQAEPVTLLKRIGSTTYVVKVHFSKTSKENMADKVMRLIKQEVPDAKRILH